MHFSQYNKDNTQEIEHLFANTFSDSEGKAEGIVIGDLVHELLTQTTPDKLLAFIATDNHQIIGSIIFTQLTFDQSDINAMILSPAAINTHRQGKGIGQALIQFSLDRLKERGVTLVITYGDPTFYSKVGFQSITETIIKAPLPLSYPNGWLGLPLCADNINKINGHSYCVEALNNPKYW